MSNTNPCGTCRHYDPILHGMKATARGWCAKKSLYPAKDSPGQVTPKGAARVDSGESAKPYLVKRDAVESQCPHFALPKKNMTPTELAAKAFGDKK